MITLRRGYKYELCKHHGFFVIFILVYVLINEIFTVLFRLTGLTEAKAKFQVTSMLTNSGFTTSDSELITSSRVRSKLARITMIFGYAFTVTIVSAVVNIVIRMNSIQVKTLWPISITLLSILLIFMALKSIPGIKKNFDHYVEKLGNRIIFGKYSNVVIILDSYDDNALAEIIISNIPDILRGVALEDTPLKNKFNINVLMIKREYEYMRIIGNKTILQEGDTIVVFGECQNIRNIFENVK